MATRSKVAAVTAGSALALGALAGVRRRTRARAAVKGFVEDVMPSVLEETPTVPTVPHVDEAHAEGHRHIPLAGPAAREPTPRRVWSRPFAKHRHGLRHPGRG